MAEATNRIRELYKQGKPSFGTYVTFPSAPLVESTCALGFDFVRLDAYRVRLNPETIDNLIGSVYHSAATPWVRSALDARDIGFALDAGAQVISTTVDSIEEAKAAVAAVRYQPAGDRVPRKPWRFPAPAGTDHLEWARENVLLSLHIESRGGYEDYREIVRLDGVDIIQYGKQGVATALGGIRRDQSGYGTKIDPRAAEAEKAVMKAALDAGKQASLVESVTEEGLERCLRWIEEGVLIMCLDIDSSILAREYGRALKFVRDRQTGQTAAGAP